MWPKALSQLIELAPHVTRLLPLADRYFKDKNTGDDATRQALDTHRATLEAQRASITDLGDRLHADIGVLSSAQTTQATQASALQQRMTAIDQQLSGILRPIADLEKHLTGTRADALAAKRATESLEGRLSRMEAAQGRTQTLAIVAVALLVAILVLIATMFLRTR